MIKVAVMGAIGSIILVGIVTSFIVMGNALGEAMTLVWSLN